MKNKNVLISFTSTVYRGSFLPPKDTLELEHDLPLAEYYKCTQLCYIYTTSGEHHLAWYTFVESKEESNELESYWLTEEDVVVPLDEVLFWMYMPGLTIRDVDSIDRLDQLS